MSASWLAAQFIKFVARSAALLIKEKRSEFMRCTACRARNNHLTFKAKPNFHGALVTRAAFKVATFHYLTSISGGSLYRLDRQCFDVAQVVSLTRGN